MVEHIVLFRWRPDASTEQIEEVIAGLRELKALVPGIVDISCGRNFSDRAQGYDVGLVVRFTDRAALEAYGPHPAHQRVVQQLINPIRDAVLAVDYEM